jgi:large subunit ribosomal protein L21
MIPMWKKGYSIMNNAQKISEFEKYAIIETGGKQYQALPGKTICIEKIEGNAGDKIQFDNVLFRKTDDTKFEFGTPFIKNASVKASIIKQDKAPKLVIFKFQRRHKVRTKKGHRQPQTIIRIESI